MITKLLSSLLVVISLFFAVPAQAFAASLSLSPTTGTFNKGCNFNLDIILDTAGAGADGTDVYLLYDTSKVSANSISTGHLYSDYSGNNIDNQAGKVVVSGVSSDTPYNGKGTFATVNFTMKDTGQPGATQIKFDFDENDKSKVSDSNVMVVETSAVTDVLTSVTDGNYTVGTAACGTVGQGATGTSTGSATTTTTTTTTTLPLAGSENFTATIAIIGSVLTILGILGLVIL